MQDAVYGLPSIHLPGTGVKNRLGGRSIFTPSGWPGEGHGITWVNRGKRGREGSPHPCLLLRRFPSRCPQAVSQPRPRCTVGHP